MKYLVYSPYSMEANAISALLDKSLRILENNDNEVVFISCSGECRPCDSNAESSKIRCFECRYSSKIALKYVKNSRLFHKELNDYIDDKIIHENNNLSFNYKSAEDVKKITYKEINIGLGVISSFVSITRNLNPIMENVTNTFISDSLKSAAILIDLFNKIIDKESPDKIVIFNGRYNSMRPLFELAKFRGINVEVLECTFSNSHAEQKLVSFQNALPHDIDNNSKIIENYWDNYVGTKDKEEIAKLFFFNRRNGVVASDKVYIANQIRDKLPQSWDGNKRNFVIFNSSEDEFFSVGDAFDKYKIFESQLEGVKFLCESVIDCDDIHFYLRIHPNLNGLNFKYHTDLMSLNYKNLTVIPAQSNISTYALIDNCEKVFVFGSTAGVEANFWGKPVVLLGGAFYIHLNVAYYPSDLNELKKLIKDKLESMLVLGALKYALFLYGQRGIEGKYISYNYEIFSFLGKTISIPVFFLKKNRTQYLLLSAFFRLINLPLHLIFKKNILPKLKKEM